MAITQERKEDGIKGDIGWYDVARLEVLDLTPVIDRPDFKRGYATQDKEACQEHIAAGKKGPAEKPKAQNA